MRPKKIKVALIHYIISPYRIPVFNALAKYPDIDLTVYFLNTTAANRKWKPSFYQKHMKFKYYLLKNFHVTFPFHEPLEYNINFSIINELRTHKYDAVISFGWVDFGCQAASILKSFLGYKFILWAGSTKDEPSVQRTLFQPLVKFMIKQADYLISYGTKSSEYLHSLGAPKNSIISSYNTVDTDHFAKVASLSPKRKTSIIKRYNLDKDHKIILYVGQFIRRKNVETLIQAVGGLDAQNTTLVLLGYGPLKNTYLQMSKDLHVDLKIVNHLEIDKIPDIYGIADIFVLPSTEEVWGLVVNEAMASGLPVLVSNKVGCVPDLLQEGGNGFSFNPNDSVELTHKLQKIFSSPRLQRNMSLKSREIIENFTPQKAAEAFYQAIKKSL